MATVLVLTPDALLRARFRGAWAWRHRVVDLPAWPALRDMLLLRRGHLLVVDTAPTLGIDLAATFRWLRTRHPELGTIAVLDPVRTRRLPYRLGRWGVDGVLPVHRAGESSALQRTVQTALARALARTVTRDLEGRCDPLLLRCIARASEGAAVGGLGDGDLAEPEGLTVGSLRHRLRRRGLPPPGRIRLWGRLFAAAAALERGDGPVDRVAHGLGYSTGAALSRALRDGVGHPPTTLRERGGLACALEAFLDREAVGAPGPGGGSR